MGKFHASAEGRHLFQGKCMNFTNVGINFYGHNCGFSSSVFGWKNKFNWSDKQCCIFNGTSTSWVNVVAVKFILWLCLPFHVHIEVLQTKRDEVIKYVCLPQSQRANSMAADFKNWVTPCHLKE